ncbi:MAG: DNA-directed RNA polymerase subunit alpha C-terminal domain-containing protein, partial [Armatimonadota bacterium]
RFFFDLGRATQSDILTIGEEATTELSNVPEIKLEELDFSQRTFNCLRRAGIMNLRQLAAVNEGDLTSIRGFGRKSLTEVRDKLEEHGIELKPAKGGFVNFDLLDDDDI